MICPDCGYEMRYPAELSFTPDHPLRMYECLQCNMTFETIEILRDTAQHQAFQATMFKIISEQDKQHIEEDQI